VDLSCELLGGIIGGGFCCATAVLVLVITDLLSFKSVHNRINLGLEDEIE
jgi:hypothetical protein